METSCVAAGMFYAKAVLTMIVSRVGTEKRTKKMLDMKDGEKDFLIRRIYG